MSNINKKPKFGYLILPFVFLFSCTTTVPLIPFPTEKLQVTKIAQEYGPSVVYIATYDRKGELHSIGSGFFVSQDGIIATNYHVIQGSFAGAVKTSTGKRYKDVYILSYDIDKDVALLQVNENNASAVTIGDPDTAKQGDEVITIGNPEGLQNTVSDGIISAIREVEGTSVFQITCPISKGSSGGPLFNLNGEVVGLTTLMWATGQNLNFAIPISVLTPLLHNQSKLSLAEKALKDKDKLLLDYKERQKASSKLEPEDALFEEASDFYKMAKAATKYPEYFESSGTTDDEAIEYLKKALDVNPHYHAAHFVLARSYSRNKQYEKAEKSFLKAIELKPKYQDAYCSLAYVYVNTKKYDQAIESLFAALNHGPATSEIYYGLAEAQAAKDKMADAEEFYKKAIDLRGSFYSERAVDKLAGLYLKKGDLKASWKYLIKTEPFVRKKELPEKLAIYEPYLKTNNFYAFVSLGHICYHSVEYKKAIEYFEKAFRLHPKRFAQYYELGMAYQKEGNFQNAVKNLEKAVALDSYHYDAHLQLGMIYGGHLLIIDDKGNFQKERNYPRALELLKATKSINPRDYDSYYYLSKTYYDAGRYYDALAEAKETLAIQESTVTFSLLGDIYFAMEDYEKALDAYRNSINELLDWGLSRGRVADTLVKLERYDEAITFLEESLKLKQVRKFSFAKSNLKTKLGEVYREKGDYEAAIRCYKETLAISPKNYSAHFGIASCYFDQEEWDESAKWYKEASKLNPKDSAPFYNIALTYANRDQWSEALNWFKKALTINPSDASTKEKVEACQLAIERLGFSDKLRKLSTREDEIGLLAKLLLVLKGYDKANDLWLQGTNETTYKDGAHNVSSKIYEAQGHYEKLKSDLSKVTSPKGQLKQAVDLFSFAVQERTRGIELHSTGYYTKVKDYVGQYEKGVAKIKIADSYLVDALKILQAILPKYKSHFGELGSENLTNAIQYYDR